ncbi:MAG: hypothetical protein HN742_00995 [Lentisphaerae bacterium]|jgi:hypothetical protein|nr:hypothetical protein [Lentisphaerota bacterium]MBT4816314.1 hypothetical protein [Lentisphaerota bacterium]MBT5612389.1 hypothetical protein [Lentisphaerota bacterium]MBT7057752.1 hypothetical protein [Lentisphaerota bacterium]MBT7840409.1 hypothetical protein [Lentisphaerota bacterium]
MFQVSKMQPIDGELTSICSGTVFGFMDRPVSFHVTSDEVDDPLTVRLTVTNDKRRKACELEIGGISGSELNVTFFNPDKTGTCGVRDPAGLLKVGGYALGLIFHLTSLGKAESFALAYEFYDICLSETLDEE